MRLHVACVGLTKSKGPASTDDQPQVAINQHVTAERRLEALTTGIATYDSLGISRGVMMSRGVCMNEARPDTRVRVGPR